jgi:hypothetical protein
MTIKREFSQCSLKRERDPEDWIKQLLLMNTRLEGMGYKMPEMEIIVHILNNLPREYESVVEQIEGDLDIGLTVDLDKVKNKLRSKFGRIKSHVFKNPSRVTEGALFAGQEGFKGNCRKCGEYGHKAAKCPKRREEFKCNYCTFKGHTKEFCRRKKKDQEEGGHMEVLMAQAKIEEIPNIREEEGVFYQSKRRVWDKHGLETQVPLVT